MASSSASGRPSAAAEHSKKILGFMSHAKQRKESFIQFFAMTGILMLSMRSLNQKYKLHGLEQDTHALRVEHASLSHRINNIKNDLLLEASRDSTGLFASRLRHLFDQHH